MEGLSDKRLTQASFRRAPVDEVMAVADQYKSRYRGWNVKHFYSMVSERWGAAELHLGEEHASVKGLVSKASKRGVHRKRRERVTSSRNDAASGWEQP